MILFIGLLLLGVWALLRQLRDWLDRDSFAAYAVVNVEFACLCAGFVASLVGISVLLGGGL